MRETFAAKDRAGWRDWLEEYHANKTEIWLINYKKQTGKQTMSYQDAVDEALCFGWIDSSERRLDDERTALRFTPRRPKSHWTAGNIARYHILERQGLVTEVGKAAFTTNQSR